MKIIMIEPLGDGGIAHYSFNLLNALKKYNLDTYLYTTANYEFINKKHGHKLFPKMFRLYGLLIKFFPILCVEKKIPSLIRRTIKIMEYPFNIFELLYLIRRESIRIVHIQSVNWIELLMILLLKMLDVKICFTVHNVKPLHKEITYFHRHMYKRIYLLCDHIIIHTQEGKEKIILFFSAKREKISVIPHGDYKFFLPDKRFTKELAKERLDLNKNEKTLLFFGAIRPNKGLDQALLALNHVRESIQNVTLLIVGELCEDFKRYEKIIKDFNLGMNVKTYLEYIPNESVPLFFSAADIVILPYYDITQSGVLQIAYAFSKPVIATDIDGFKESIEDRKNGFLVSLGDYQEFAKKIIELLCNEENIIKMGKHSRYIADHKYSWNSIAQETKKLYLSL